MDFFRSGRMLWQLNQTIINHVPKFEHSPSVPDYRPISCCNVIYKVITKIITDRISLVLEHLIDSSQVALIGGRNIIDNIFLAQEMVRQYSRKRIHLFVLLTSTYVKLLTWSYGRFFPESSTGLNGSLHGFFLGKKGLRQRDSMSPALFLLCMEFFSHLIKMNTSNSDFNFHTKCEKLKITHLLFVDDFMLFSRGDLPSVHILMECLQEFRDVSGLAVNTFKSSIFTAGIQNDVLEIILARMEFSRGNMHVRYLGIPLAAKRLLINDYSPLVDQIAGRISKWTANSLSFAGPSSKILREHRWLGRKFAIRRRKATHYGANGSMKSTSEGLHFGTSSRRKMILHSFDDLPTFETNHHCFRLYRCTSSAYKGLETSKAYEYFRPKLRRQPRKSTI
ncbi:hypothetical protein Sango_2689500 [Sesamum angolense]|uniref:Reverse transcriptase domain-containing protein n=1 Tax=Sesamum angolense TaxID=2727404 RepID=A0AAE2BHM4_9LAMI|nr:hypothetical protein Sango_2689500 [Sesamum angolense]